MLLQRAYCTVFALVVLFSIVLNCGCSKIQDPVPAATKATGQDVVAVSAVLSTIAADERPASAESTQKHSQTSGTATRALTKKQPDYFQIELNRYGKGAAYIARVGDRFRVVHNNKPGKLYKEIDGSTLMLSQDGQHVGYGASYDAAPGASSGSDSNAKWVLVHDGIEEGPFNSLGPPVFSPDGKHIAFECKIGERWKIFVDTRSYGDAFSYIDKPLFNSDSTLLLFGETEEPTRKPRMIVSDLEFKKQRVIDQSGGPHVINEEKTRAAVITTFKNKKRVVSFDFSLSGAFMEGAPYDEVRNIVFGPDGRTLAYLAKNGTDTFLVSAGKEERLPMGDYPWPPVVRPDNKGAAIAIAGKDGAYLYQAFGGGGASPNRYKEIADVAYSPDGKSHAYVAIKNERFLIVVNGKEGPFFDRVITPQFSPDGKFLVYRARQDNKRFVVVADATGKIIREHPRYERVFETIFTLDGGSVAYGVEDGSKILWKVEKLK